MVIQRIAFLVTESHRMNDRVGQIDRDEVQAVHQDDPEKHRQGKRGNKLAGGFVIDDAARLLINHVDEHFDRALELARNAGRRTTGSHPHQEHGQQTHGG